SQSAQATPGRYPGQELRLLVFGLSLGHSSASHPNLPDQWPIFEVFKRKRALPMVRNERVVHALGVVIDGQVELVATIERVPCRENRLEPVLRLNRAHVDFGLRRHKRSSPTEFESIGHAMSQVPAEGTPT